MEKQIKRTIGGEERFHMLGQERVREKLYHDYMSTKTCVQGDTHVRSEQTKEKPKIPYVYISYVLFLLICLKEVDLYDL